MARLEARRQAEEPIVIFITSYEAGPDDPNAAMGEIYKVIVLGNPDEPSRAFARLPGETEQEFLRRARA